MWGSSAARFFRSHSWRGQLRHACLTLPSLPRFWVMHHHFNGELFRMAHSPPVTSLSPHSYGSRVVRYSLRLPVRTFNARLTSNAISMRSISVLVPVWGLPCGAERFLRSERLPGRPHTGSSVWIRPPVWYFCGSFAYSFSLIYKKRHPGSP